jgi:hypothetical protein
MKVDTNHTNQTALNHPGVYNETLCVLFMDIFKIEITINRAEAYKHIEEKINLYWKKKRDVDHLYRVHKTTIDLYLSELCREILRIKCNNMEHHTIDVIKGIFDLPHYIDWLKLDGSQGITLNAVSKLSFARQNFNIYPGSIDSLIGYTNDDTPTSMQQLHYIDTLDGNTSICRHSKNGMFKFEGSHYRNNDIDNLKNEDTDED